MKIIELKPIKESTEDFEKIEKRMKELFKKEVYYPLLAHLNMPRKTIQNSQDALIDALRNGKVTFNQGLFTGQFNSFISKELKALGAVWDRKQKGWKIQKSELPIEIKNEIAGSEVYFKKKLSKIDDQLSQVIPEELADKIKVSDIFDKSIWKTEQEMQKTVKNLTVMPELSDAARKKLADEWQNNMKLWIKDFTEKEIKDLRQKVLQSAQAGNRYESLIQTIQDSYNVTADKAKFLARQETNLLMTKLKETRYTDAGIHEYRWQCVAGTAAHPVRESHQKLNGKVFRWDDPPITTMPGEPPRRNNPGCDFNCRCVARPLVKV